ncbi:heterodisulfide reductase-related iron-sulfur binding cluster [Syntrophotalea carbinolica]|nr:heterodisulfide reductase-related iron-sulfur binding cluster [Syntrophotalea carbinolica]
MSLSDRQEGRTPEKILCEVIHLCADCDACRDMMGEDCAFFIELYRLNDQKRESGIPISEKQLRYLAELCTFCGLCPCPQVPMDVMEAKSLYVDKEGMALATRLLSDVPFMARLCGTFPRLSQALQSNRFTGAVLRKAVRIHSDRNLPVFPKDDFFRWAAKHGLDRPQDGNNRVAYFAGCTAGYLFPAIARSVVEILQHHGATVYVPPQQCCGMPYLVEGDRKRTLGLARANMDGLLGTLRDGYELVYSCPTCGYFLKNLLKDRAYYSGMYQQSVDARDGEIKVPAPEKGKNQFWTLRKSAYRNILKDDGYFSSINPMERIELSDHLQDFGLFLRRLQANGQLDTDYSRVSGPMVYFAPCHLREQKIGRPYLDLLKMIPGLDIQEIGNDYDCCGMGGVFGFKEHFHQKSLDLGRALMEKIRAQNPRAIVTDCMSCRLQFNHCLPYPVFHPVEVLARAYKGTVEEG